MRHYAKYILLLTATALTACSDNEADIPDDKSNPDPVGTVSTTMYNEDNGDTHLGSMHIDRDGNFVGCDMVIISDANGLSDVASIPKSGYSGTSKVMPKTCYVTYLDGEWCRLYVEKTISTSKASATGAKVKYQKPFRGKNEALLLSESEIVYAAEGGNTIVTINNNSIIPFSATSSAEWCNVTIGSTLEQTYLTDAVSVDVLPSNSTKDETATVSLTTLYGKTTTITITRRGVVPSIETEQNIRIGHSAKEFTIPVTTNLPLSDLTVKADVDWLSVELAAVDKAETSARPLRWLGYKPVAPIKAKSPSAPAPETIIVKCVTKANTDTERSATITISSKTGRHQPIPNSNKSGCMSTSASASNGPRATSVLTYPKNMATTTPGERLQRKSAIPTKTTNSTVENLTATASTTSLTGLRHSSPKTMQRQCISANPGVCLPIPKQPNYG